MASLALLYHNLSLLLSILTVLLINTARLSLGCYSRIFSFGDSLTDTGNFHIIVGNDTTDPFYQLPYGETFFHHPTGRYSDGRVILDFIAEEFGLPFVSPYLGGKSMEDFRHGTNFAVAGASAMNHSFFKEKGIPMNWEAGYLAVQIEWFKELLTLLCPLSDCRHIMEDAFFLVGEIGVNDYNFPTVFGTSFNEIRTFAPGVISAISSAIKDLIELGAKTLVVPGMIPLGCTPFYLTAYQGQRKEDYNSKTGCLTQFNEFSEYHDSLLLDELARLRKIYPNVTIIYADYYAASMSIFESPQQYGIKEPLVACCGVGGRYNFSMFVNCVSEESNLCDDPAEYVSWDGTHLTEAANKIVARGVLDGLYSDPPISISCPNLEHNKAPLVSLL